MATATQEQTRPFPPQHQDSMPGIEAEMHPLPEYEDPDWIPRGDLDGKVALVTGGDSGIGRAVSVLFAKEGADVAIAYLASEQTDAAQTESRIRELGRACLSVPGDLADPQHTTRLAEQIQKEFGRLDTLVANASVQWVHDDLAESSPEEIRRTLDSNILSNILTVEACLPLMAEGGSVIVTTSVTAYRGSDHLAVYSATKGALLAFMRAMSKQLLGRGIRVNGVAPGPVWTPLIVGSFPPDEVATFGSDAPMGRAAQPREIAPSFLFLASDRYSSYFAGQVLHPNGGEIVNA